MTTAIKTVTVDHSRERRRIAEGTVETCCHVVDWWLDIGKRKISDSDLEQMESEAEERAAECIAQGYHSGELCTVLHGDDYEVFGWWSIRGCDCP